MYVIKEKGYRTKNNLSYAIKDSLELGLKILEQFPDLRIHICTAKLKDSVQLANRIKLRAINIKKHYDILTPEGSLIRGVIYTEKPSFNYQKELENKDKKKEIKNLKQLKKEICKEVKIHPKDLDIDKQKLRFLCSRKIINKHKEKIKQLNLIPGIVEEYPTKDQFEIELEFL